MSLLLIGLDDSTMIKTVCLVYIYSNCNSCISFIPDFFKLYLYKLSIVLWMTVYDTTAFRHFAFIFQLSTNKTMRATCILQQFKGYFC